MKTALTIFVLTCLAFLAYVRFVPSPPDVWHVDPQTVKKQRKRNVFLMQPDNERSKSPEFEVDALTLARALDAYILSGENANNLAGSPDDLFVTYVVRTRLIGYPDYISIKFIELLDGRSTFAIYSRSRFGRNDLSVNKKRVMGWLNELELS